MTDEIGQITISVQQDAGCERSVADLIEAVGARLISGEGPGYYRFKVVAAALATNPAKA
jgi:hypothetical protein